MDELVAQDRHLACLLDLVRVVLRAEGIVAPAVAVDAVGDVIVMLPEPVFLFDRGEDIGRIGFGLRCLLAVNPVGEQAGELLIAGFVGDESTGGEGAVGLGEEFPGGGEEVDECQRVLLCHAFHGGGVELEVGVFLAAIG